MIIQDTIIKSDGTVETREIEVADNYFDAPPEPPIDDITALQLAIAELAEAQEATQTANELALAELAEIITGGE
jgi:hypothetical protein